MSSQDEELRSLIANLQLGRAITAAPPAEDVSKSEERDKLDRLANEIEVIKAESQRAAAAAQLELSALKNSPTEQQMRSILGTLKSSRTYFQMQTMALGRQIEELEKKINERFGPDTGTKTTVG